MEKYNITFDRTQRDGFHQNNVTSRFKAQFYDAMKYTNDIALNTYMYI